MDMDIVKDFIKTRADIRKKFYSIKRGKIQSQTQLENIFKPINKPLKKLVKQTALNNNIERGNEDLSFMQTPKLKKPKYDDITEGGDDDDNDPYETPGDSGSPDTSNIEYGDLNAQDDYFLQRYAQSSTNIDRHYGLYKSIKVFG